MISSREGLLEEGRRDALRDPLEDERIFSSAEERGVNRVLTNREAIEYLTWLRPLADDGLLRGELI